MKFNVKNIKSCCGKMPQNYYDAGVVLDSFSEETGCAKHSIDFESINDLMVFISKIGEQVILDDSFYCDEKGMTKGATITIYDDYNE
jgi:hypothetical protein